MGTSVLGGKGKMRSKTQEEIKIQKGILVKCKFNFPQINRYFKIKICNFKIAGMKN